jgi:hypothetical protein
MFEAVPFSLGAVVIASSYRKRMNPTLPQNDMFGLLPIPGGAVDFASSDRKRLNRNSLKTICLSGALSLGRSCIC